MTAPSPTFDQMTCEDFDDAIGSPGSADGITPCNSPTGPSTNPSTPCHAPASPSPAPDSRWVRLIRAIYSRRSAALSRAAELQTSLESRLRALTDVNGSPEYVLKWRHWDMPHGHPICALRGSRRRNSDSVYSGTPIALAGWPTPTVNDSRNGRNETAERTPGSSHHSGTTLCDAAILHGWNTPRASDGSNGGPNQANGALSADVHLHGWATATARDHKDGASIGTAPVNGLLGRQVWAYAETTGRGAVLSPAFHLWLMGYPAEWLLSGVAAIQSCRKSPRSSSKRVAWVQEADFE